MLRARIPAQQQERQATMATSFYENLADRLHSEQVLNLPRSRAAWSAEENRLGSWHTGVGRVYGSGIGRSYVSGQGALTQAAVVGEFDPDEVSPDPKRKP